MALSPADIVASLIPPRLTFAPSRESAAPTNDTRTPATASFDNVLATVQSASDSTATSPATSPAATPTAATVDPATGTALASIGQETLPTFASDPQFFQDLNTPESNATALALLLTATTTNVATSPVDAATVANAAAIVPPNVLAETGTPTAEPTLEPTFDDPNRSRADELQLQQSLVQQTATQTTPSPLAVLPTPTVPVSAPQEPATPPPTTPRTLTTTPTPVGITAATTADLTRAAAKLPSVVPQASLVATLPNQGLPAELPANPVLPPLPPTTPITEIQPTLAVTTSDPRPANVRAKAEIIQQALATPVTSNVPPVDVSAFSAVLGEQTLAVSTATTPLALTAIPQQVPGSLSVLPGANLAEPVLASAVPAGQLVEEAVSRSGDAAQADFPPAAPLTTGLLPPPNANPPTTTATTANPPATPAFQVSEAIANQAKLVEHNGRYEFQMRLDPPELGPVRVRLVSHGDRMTAEVVVANDTVRQMIESQLPDLRQRLEAAGLNLPQLDVSTGSRDSSRDQDAQEWQQHAFGFQQRAATTNPPRRLPSVNPSANSTRIDVIA